MKAMVKLFFFVSGGTVEILVKNTVLRVAPLEEYQEQPPHPILFFEYCVNSTIFPWPIVFHQIPIDQADKVIKGICFCSSNRLHVGEKAHVRPMDKICFSESMEYCLVMRNPLLCTENI